MVRVNPSLLSDTLNLVQLAHETARQRGNQRQVAIFEPVVDKLRGLVKREQTPLVSEPSAGILGQKDFQTLLSATQTANLPRLAANSSSERNQVVYALMAGGMKDVEIARYLGITRDEVRMVINLASIGSKNRR